MQSWQLMTGGSHNDSKPSQMQMQDSHQKVPSHAHVNHLGSAVLREVTLNPLELEGICLLRHMAKLQPRKNKKKRKGTSIPFNDRWKNLVCDDRSFWGVMAGCLSFLCCVNPVRAEQTLGQRSHGNEQQILSMRKNGDGAYL